MIFSIHQPRYSVYNVFDSITLLSDGQTAYHGARETALTHFEQQGVKKYTLACQVCLMVGVNVVF